MSRTFCDRRPKRPFVQKIALKISGLDRALEEEGGSGGRGAPCPCGRRWRFQRPPPWALQAAERGGGSPYAPAAAGAWGRWASGTARKAPLAGPPTPFCRGRAAVHPLFRGSRTQHEHRATSARGAGGGGGGGCGRPAPCAAIGRRGAGQCQCLPPLTPPLDPQCSPPPLPDAANFSVPTDLSTKTPQ